MLIKNTKKKGFMTLIIVLIVGVIALSITVSLLISGLSVSRTSFDFQQMYQVKNLAHSCAEEALQQIRDNTNFTGTGNLNFSLGSCTYTVVGTGSNNRNITTTGTIDTVTRKMEINISAINPYIVISTWQDI